MSKNLIARIVLAFVLLTTAGCVMGKPLTPAEIAEFGTKAFPAPKAKVFAASLAALKGEGYEIAFSDADKGLVKTTPKIIRATGGGGAATGVFRQYTLKLIEDGGQTKVTATPAVKIGERDLSEDAVWVIEGPEGERTLWAKLFKEIAELL